MKHRFLFLLMILPLFWGCDRNLEMEGVPIIPGIRINHYPYAEGDNRMTRARQESEIHAKNLAFMQENCLKTLMIEVPLTRDSASGDPTVDRLAIEGFARALDAYPREEISLWLSIGPDNERDLFGDDMQPRDAFWFDRLDSCLFRVEGMARGAGFKVEGVVIGDNLAPLESSKAAWPTLLAQHSEYSEVPVFYGLDITRLEVMNELPEELGISLVYPAQIPDAHKRFCREMNREASEKLSKTGRRFHIGKANLLGEEKGVQFLNRLRFWQDDIRMENMVVNSIFPEVPFVKSHDAFGWEGQEKDFEVVKEYLGGCE